MKNLQENNQSFFEWWEDFTELMYAANYVRAIDKDFVNEELFENCGMTPKQASEHYLEYGKGFDCEKCDGISLYSNQCENHSCPNMPCCGKSREECKC